jgi:uncharacterized protein YbjT (DUF2867 family)
VKIFFSGATGVIGRRAIPHLIAAGHEITAVARSPAKADALKKIGARPAIADLFDNPALREAVARPSRGANASVRPGRLPHHRASRIPQNPSNDGIASRIMATLPLHHTRIW